jgi:hypothetical protein
MAEDLAVFQPSTARKLLAMLQAWERTPGFTGELESHAYREHFPFLNSSGFDIPPYGVVLIDGTTEQNGINYLVAKRYSGSATTQSFPLVNGPYEVKDGEYGSPQLGPVYRVIHDGASYAIGSQVGWKVNSFLVTSNTNFRVFGNDDIEPNCLRVARDFTDSQAQSDTLERFVMNSNWVGGVAAATFTNLSEPSIPVQAGVVEDPLGIFTDILGVGGQGLSIRTRYGRHYVIQAKCDQLDVPPVDPTGACEVYVEGVGSQCFVTTSAVCTLLGGTYGGNGTSCP